MICPVCGHDNLPGIETCSHCQHDLTTLDRPAAANHIEFCLMHDPVSSVKSTPPPTMLASASLQDAIDRMADSNIGALVIVNDEGLLVGIFSERDLLTKVIGVHENFSQLRIDQFMTPRPETVAPTDTLNFVLHKMDGGGYRHVPVLDHGKPISIISVRDMLRHLTRLFKEKE